MKFLVVDDDPAILKITKKFLELNQHEVECCENALDAIQELGNLSFDILITDATMPAFSGFDLIRSVRKTPELHYLSIAMLTGRSEKSDIEQALELGVQDYIVKPIDPEVFMEKVDKLVERHKLKKAQKPVAKNYNAEMSVPVEVKRITDIGLSIESPYPLEKGTIVTLNLDELQNEGLMQNQFKAIFNSESSKSGKVLTELLLLNLSEKDQKTLSKVAKNWDKQKAA